MTAQAGAAPRFAWQASVRRRTAVVAPFEDPRLLRALPWKPADFEAQRLPYFFALCAFYGVTLAGVPVTFLVLVLRRRQWTLRSMFAAMAVAAIAMMGVWIDAPDRDFQTLPRKLVIAFFAAGPVLFTLVVLARWMWLRRWNRIVVWLTTGLLTTAALMGLSVAATFWREAGALQPGERYVWDGWYWMIPPAFYLTTWALFLCMVGSWLAQIVWSRLRYLRQVQNPAAH